MYLQKKIKKRRLLGRFFVILFLTLLLLLSITYAIVYVVNQTGNFTIMPDKNLQEKKTIIVSPRSDFAVTPTKMVVDALQYNEVTLTDLKNNDVNYIPATALKPVTTVGVNGTTGKFDFFLGELDDAGTKKFH